MVGGLMNEWPRLQWRLEEKKRRYSPHIVSASTYPCFVLVLVLTLALLFILTVARISGF